MSIPWFDGVLLTAEAALSSATGSYGAWDVGLWGTATWGPDVVWTDISAYLRSLATQRRFSRDLQAWEAGTADVDLNNRDGRFSPLNLTGPYVTGGVTGIRPWRPIRMRATYAGTTYPLYTGYALSWRDTYARGHAHAVTAVHCQDEYAKLAGYNGYEQTSQGAGETSGKRIHRILDSAGHTGTRNVDVGTVTVQATTLAANAATELQLTTDSEGGALWIDTDGTVCFDGQYALVEKTASNTVQASFGDAASDTVPYFDAATAYGGELVTNIAAFARTGGTMQVAADNTSRALYGDRQYKRDDLVCESDTQVAGLAQLWLARYKDPEYRITQVAIKPRTNPAKLFPQVLGRRIRDLVRVTVRPIGGYTITQDCYIAGVSHTITEDDWTTVFDLWSATPYTSFATSRWDAGVWDTATWFY